MVCQAHLVYEESREYKANRERPASKVIEAQPVAQEIPDSMEHPETKVKPDNLENKDHPDHVGTLETVVSKGSRDHVVYPDQWDHREVLDLEDDRENAEQR